MIDIYLHFHEDAGWYFQPTRYEANWRERISSMKPGTEGYENILKRYKPGRPSFDFLHYDGKKHYVGYSTAANTSSNS